MSSGSPKLARREQAIEAARRRLRRLEIETHRIKAELARLEADYEDDVADWLTRKLRPRRAKPAPDIRDADNFNGLPKVVDGGRPAVLSLELSPVAGVCDPGPKTAERTAKASSHKFEPASPKLEPLVRIADTGAATPPVRRTDLRKHTSPLMVSLAIHAVALVLCFTLTFTTLIPQITPLFASPADFDDDLVSEFSEVEIAPTKFDDAELQNPIAADEDFNIADNRLRELEPAELGAGEHPLGDIGQLDALPSDLGTLMAGAGSPGSGTPGGPAGEAVFFGARSKGDRFVFVVDNSSSMKGGRLEAATAELLKTIDSLTPRQAFYVIFVSDQTYPMFYPVAAPEMLPATPANKRRLAEWVPNAILASGKNRELIKAMDMAAALRPHAVFLLWDGDLKYSEKVRIDVMTHLTRPNQWNFTIHTLGMGVASLDAKFNLTSIAEAHGGSFQPIDIPAGQR
jgi:hypothetical protein